MHYDKGHDGRVTPSCSAWLGAIMFDRCRRRGWPARQGWHAMVLAIAIVMLLGASTPAAVAGTVSYDGNAVVFTGGDNLDHELQFRLNGAGGDDIIDSQPITAYPGDCTAVGATRISCPGHLAVRVELGDGGDRVYFNGTSDQAGDCFDSYDIRLGNGFNENVMRTTCPGPATATITAGSGNDFLRGGSASTSTTIVAGGGDDNVDDGEGDDVIHGGEGADGVFGYLGNDQVYGEGGNDKLRGGEGNDLEDGGPGDDDLGHRSVNTVGEPDPGADQLRGGEGTDRLRLDGHVGAMAISLDGQANDGTAGEGDNVGSDIESILGTSGNDVFTGSAGADGFDGGGGGDEIHGAGGNDDVRGGGGNDRVFGDAGDDFVEGANDTDTVDGGPGTDQLYGDIAGCSVFCAPDTDMLFARDGERDTVNCGGPGTAQVDQLDIVGGGCASVDRQNTLVTPPPNSKPPDSKPKPTDRPGKCSKLKGKKKKACVKKRCGRLKGKKKKACVKRVTRRR
jgi:serralysin